jgi:lipoate---protein ligase
MFCLNLNSTDPFFNLAVDEYLLKNSREEFLILGINEKSVIIGKHQCANRETDTKFINLNAIPVIRRITGGGTVFHDSGNLNFSFILNSREGKQIDFRKYTLPVIGFLLSLGVKAEFGGKNDLLAGGLKISGNAEHVYRDRVLHHGTLLFNASLEMLRGSLRKDTSGYKTRAVRSNPSQVINLAGMLKGVATINDFRSLMLNWFIESPLNLLPVKLKKSDCWRIQNTGPGNGIMPTDQSIISAAGLNSWEMRFIAVCWLRTG